MFFQAKPPLMPGPASSVAYKNRRPVRGDDSERQDVNSEHGRHGSGTFNGKATRPLMSRKVMLVVLREPVSVGVFGLCDPARTRLSVCATQCILCVSLFSRVCACMHLMDREQTKCVRGARGQLIQCVRCPRWVPQQQLLAPLHSQNGSLAQ